MHDFRFCSQVSFGRALLTNQAYATAQLHCTLAENAKNCKVMLCSWFVEGQAC